MDCIFCKIVNKEIPADIVYEDENFLCFLDKRPRAPGHTLIIPKDHHRWAWDVPRFEQYFEVARKIAIAQRKAFNTNSIWCGIQGDEVPHSHISTFPNPEIDENKMDFKTNAEKIRKALE